MMSNGRSKLHLIFPTSLVLLALLVVVDPFTTSPTRRPRTSFSRRDVSRNGRCSQEGQRTLALGASWNLVFERLAEYRKEHGDCNVPRGYCADPQLANWVKNQRAHRKNNKLAHDRFERLDEIGFRWQNQQQRPSWEEQLGNLKRYKEEHGDCNVPHVYLADPQLGNWVTQQRANYKNNKLVDDRYERLKDIGFSWPKQQLLIWEEKFRNLKRYKEEHGDCNVPSGYLADPRLANWVHMQRAIHKKNKLADERYDRLDEIGFRWSIQRLSWEEELEKLKRYKEEHGDCNVPSGYLADPQLATWVLKQRRDYKNSKLTDDHHESLDEIGFSWPKQQLLSWEEQLGNLKRYKEEHGDCNVPSGYLTDPRLTNWVSRQRRDYKNNKLTDERYDRLDEIGFSWSVQHCRWEEQFRKLKSYKEEHGDCHVPQIYPADPQLASWVDRQRANHKKNKLTDERYQCLNEIGFRWSIQYLTWEEQFENLKKYEEVHGDCNVPIGYLADPHLGGWVQYQRTKHKNGKLADDRRERLNEIGFFWSIYRLSWREQEQLGIIDPPECKGWFNIKEVHQQDNQLMMG